MGRVRNPFRGLIDHMSEMNRMREYIESGGQGHEDQRRTHATAWIPTTDIFARGDDLVIRCELAGVQRDDVDVTLSNGVLTISGERSSGLNEEELTYYTRERSFGHFRRNIGLPEGVDGSRLSASFEDGLLEISIEGRADLPQAQRIQIDDRVG
jgi:HSP20 family protein